MTWVLILTLWSATTGCLVFLLLRQNPTSTSPSPTPNTTPTPISEDALMTILKAMMENSQTAVKEMRALVIDMTQGRDSPRQIGPLEIEPSSSYKPPNYDDDSIPLSPALDSVFLREATEDEHQRLQRERDALIDELAQRQRDWELLQASSEPPSTTSPTETSPSYPSPASPPG